MSKFYKKVGGVFDYRKLHNNKHFINSIIIFLSVCLFVFILFIINTPLTKQQGIKDVNAWSGQGTASNPYVLTTQSDLTTLANNVNSGNSYSGQYFELGNDITITATTWTPIGLLNTPFSASFNGKNHTITFSNSVTMNVGDEVYIGFWGYILGDSNKISLKNLTINYEKTVNITNSSNNIIAGGIVGAAENCDIIYCTTKGHMDYRLNVRAMSFVGAMIGLLDGNMSQCHNELNIDFVDAGGQGIYLSGLVSTMKSGDISNCYNAGYIMSEQYIAQYSYVAGIVTNYMYINFEENSFYFSNEPVNIYNCYNSGDFFTMGDYLYQAGIVNSSGNSMIYNSFNVGRLDFSYLGSKNACVGGITNEWGQAEHCYYDRTYMRTGAYLYGDHPNYSSASEPNIYDDEERSNYGLQNLSAEMKKQSTFENGISLNGTTYTWNEAYSWDFENVWQINANENNGFPTLREPVESTLTIDLAGGTSTMQSSYTNTVGEVLILIAPTRVGHQFAGWTLNGGGTLSSDNSSFTFGSSNAKLTAQWTSNTNIIVYNGNGATSGQMSNQTITYGSGATLSGNTFIRQGFVFRYWNTMPDGTGVTYFSNTSVDELTSNSTGQTINLFAIWEEVNIVLNFTIDFTSVQGDYIILYLVENNNIVQTLLIDSNYTLTINLQSNTSYMIFIFKINDKNVLNQNLKQVKYDFITPDYSTNINYNVNIEYKNDTNINGGFII